MTLRALLFDVDGTLSDTEETHRRAFNAAFRDFDLPYAWSEGEYLALLDVVGGKERLAHYFAGLSAPTAERDRLVRLVPALHKKKTERFAEIVASGGSPLRPGIARLLDEAERAGLRLGIASTTTADNVVALLHAAFGPAGPSRFSVTACGDRVAAKKPSPDIYDVALSELGVGPAEVVAFEDSIQGLTAAKRAGLFTVATPTRWTRAHDLAAADLLLPHLGDPELPLAAEDVARFAGSSAPYLTLERLVALHGSSKR